MVELLGRGSWGVHYPCWQEGAEEPWRSAVLSWCAWCCGDPGVGLVLVLPPERFLWQGSLEQCLM
jgi:hypothetical protein